MTEAWPKQSKRGADAQLHRPRSFGARLYANPDARIGIWLISALVLFVVVGPLLIAHDPLTSDFTLSRGEFGAPPGPSFSHPLGTDGLFRDILARLAAGGRLSLGVATLATAIAVLLGTAVGVAAGMAEGGRATAIDSALMRLLDALLALPFLLFVTAIGAAVGRPDIGTLLVVLGVTGWTGTARIVRDKTRQIRQRDFVLAARGLGGGVLHEVRKHILPNLGGTLFVVAATSVGHMILAEAVLSYLTLGTQPPTPSWGRMLHEAEPLLSTQLLKVAAPGFAILLTVLATSRIAEGARTELEPRDSRTSAIGGNLRQRVPFDLVMALAVFCLVAIARPTGMAGPLRGVPGTESPTRGGTLRLATFVNIRTLDPALAYDEATTPIEALVFARLVTWDADGHVIPDLAERFEVSEDGRTYSFHLRSGVRFHDGSVLSAADVVRSFERTLRPNTPSPGGEHYASIEGFSDFRSGKAEHLSGLRVASDHDLVIELSEPNATFLALLTLSFVAPVCPSMGFTVDTQTPVQPCGAGPFRLASFEPESGIRLVRHEAYYVAGLPYLDAIEWSLGVPTQTQRYRFEDGSMDVLRELSSGDSARFVADPRWEGLHTWVTKKATNAIFLNTELPPFDSVAMRRAVSFAVDPSVLPKVRLDVAETDRVLPPSVPGPARTQPMRRHDVAEALRQMALAGFPFDPVTGQGGYPRELDYVTVPDSFEQHAAEVYAQQLAKVGIRIRLRLAPFATYLAGVSRRRTTTMGWTGWGADFPDPSNFFEPTLSSKTIHDEGSQNVAFFSNEELDRVLLLARAELNHERRMALYERAEEIVHDLSPWIPTTVSRGLEVRQPYVHGMTPHPFLPFRLFEVWLDGGGARSGRGAWLGHPRSNAFEVFVKPPDAKMPFATAIRTWGEP